MDESNYICGIGWEKVLRRFIFMIFGFMIFEWI